MRKHILPLWLLALTLNPVLGQHSSFYPACQIFAEADAFYPGLSVAASKSTVREPYIGRDEDGNKQLGTDSESESGFGRDPQSGDRTFRVKPRKQDDEYQGPDTVIIAPEVRPGHYPAGRPR